jgi:hypothetical protein
MVQTRGKRWVEIAQGLLGRSDNAIKNYWNFQLRHRVESFESKQEELFAVTEAKLTEQAPEETFSRQVV